VLGEVIAERALADTHELGSVLLDATGGVERTSNRLAFEVASTTARSIAFSSSRTFPGQSYA
jgi:hypothetical protein